MRLQRLTSLEVEKLQAELSELQKLISELKEIGKPFIVVLNSTHPMLPETERLAEKLKDSYKVPVMPISIENIKYF